MTDIDLNFIARKLDQVLTEMRDIRDEMRGMRERLARIEQDIGSLGRVMLRFESRLHTLEETSSK